MSADLSNLTVGEFLHTLRQVVAEKGADYVYTLPKTEDPDGPNCLYRDGDKPSCLIGYALDRLGYTVPSNMEGWAASEVLAILSTPREVGRVADVAQAEQDEGHTWGEALKCAEAEADARAFT